MSFISSPVAHPIREWRRGAGHSIKGEAGSGHWTLARRSHDQDSCALRQLPAHLRSLLTGGQVHDIQAPGFARNHRPARHPDRRQGLRCKRAASLPCGSWKHRGDLARAATNQLCADRELLRLATSSSERSTGQRTGGHRHSIRQEGQQFLAGVCLRPPPPIGCVSPHTRCSVPG